MKKYKTLLFDLDDTLVDNSVATRYAYKKVLEALNKPITEEILDDLEEQANELWREFDEQRFIFPPNIDKAQEALYVRIHRFQKQFGLDLKNASKMNQIFQKNQGVSIIPITDAVEVITECAKTSEIFITTNGPIIPAQEKLKKLGIHDSIKEIIAFENALCGKPSKEFFDYVLTKTLTGQKKDCLIIGDSLETDIRGGVINNIDSCWLNPKKRPNNTLFKPTYEIEKLIQLIKK